MTPLQVAKLLIIGALVALFCYGTYAVEESRFLRVAAKQKQALDEAIEKARRAEGEVARLNNATEAKDANDKTKRAAELHTARTHTAHFGGLRDPGMQAATDAASAASCAGRDSGAGGERLSQAATDFLLQLTNDADSVYDQLRLCQDYAVNLRAACAR